MALTTITNGVSASTARGLINTAFALIDSTAATAATALQTNSALGTPAAGSVLTNCTGTAAGLTAGNVTTNANLTGHVTSVGNAAVLGSFTLAQLSTAVSDANIARIDAGQTFAGSQIYSGDQCITVNGAASTPGLKLSGSVFTGGSATTTKPYLHIEPTGTTSTNWSTAGTQIGINAASGFAGNAIQYQLNNVIKFQVAYTGAVTMGATSPLATAFGTQVVGINGGGDYLDVTLATTKEGVKWKLYDSGSGNVAGIVLCLSGMQFYGALSSDFIWTTDNVGTERMRLKHTTGRLGIGQSSPTAQLEVKATTEQMRIAYDASNYMTVTQSAATGITFASVATTTSQFSFTGAVNVSSTLAVTGASTLTGLLTANGGITVGSGQVLKLGNAAVSDAAAISTHYITVQDSTGTTYKLMVHT